MYLPVHDNLNEVRRVVVNSVGDEVCDEVDNDCDGQIDEEGVCDGTDLEVTSAIAGQSDPRQSIVQVQYSLANRGSMPTGDFTDSIVLLRPDQAEPIPLERVSQSSMAGQESRQNVESVSIPQSLASGNYTVLL